MSGDLPGEGVSARVPCGRDCGKGERYDLGFSDLSRDSRAGFLQQEAALRREAHATTLGKLPFDEEIPKQIARMRGPAVEGSGHGFVAGPAVDSVVDLLAMDRDFPGSDDRQPYLIAPDFHDRHRDVVIDHNGLVLLPADD
jgi:hypothetical protein